MLNINVRHIQEEINAAGRGNKTEIVNRYAAMFGVSRDTIYRELRKEFGKRKTVFRKNTIPEELIKEIAKMKEYGRSIQLDGREVSTELCIELLQEKQFPGADQLTVSTANRRLAKNGYRVRDGIVLVEADHINQEHQLDFTRSKYFQMYRRDQGGDWILRCSGKELHYKDDDRKLRTWIVGIIDSYSRLAVAKAYPATGESSALGIDFLGFAYTRPEDDNPFRSLPEIFKTDNGAFIKDQSTKALLNALGVNSKTAKPYGHRGIQKIESLWRKIWQRFELPLAIKLGEKSTIRLSEYNELIHEFLICESQKQHPVINDSKIAVYMASLAKYPERIVDADLREVAFRVEERVVRDTLLISLNKQHYQCPDGTQGKRIRVYKNLSGNVVGTLVDEFKKPFILKPHKGYTEYNDFEHRPHNTYRQDIETEVEREKSASTTLSNGENKRLFMPGKKETVKPETVFEQTINDPDYVFPSAYTAKVYIGKHLPGNETYETYAFIFDDMLAETLKRSAIDQVLHEINQPQILSM